MCRHREDYCALFFFLLFFSANLLPLLACPAAMATPSAGVFLSMSYKSSCALFASHPLLRLSAESTVPLTAPPPNMVPPRPGRARFWVQRGSARLTLQCTFHPGNNFSLTVVKTKNGIAVSLKTRVTEGTSALHSVDFGRFSEVCLRPLLELDVSGPPFAVVPLCQLENVHQLLHCRQLRRLHMRCTSLPTLAGVPTQYLQVLNLFGCARLDTVDALAGARFLTHVNLGRTRIRHIHALQSCSILVTVSVDGCTALTDLSQLGHKLYLQVVLADDIPISTIEFARSCPCLARIDLQNCARLRDLSPLGALPHLLEVNARGSGAQVVSSLHNCPTLKCLDLRDTPQHMLSRGV